MSLADEIANFMLIKDRTWKIGGELQAPSPKDVQAALDKAKEVLYGEDVSDGAALFVGGMIIKRDGTHLDVYLHLGSIDED
jgi:hypothetical protein